MKWIFTMALLAALAPQVGAHERYERPILKELNPVPYSLSSLNEQRDDRYAKLLGMSVKIHVDGASGSGTICHYDRDSGTAHIISCGHLWSGNMKYDPGNRTRPKAKIVTWRKNSDKLSKPEVFDAEVLFWSNDRGYDVSLLRFKPDWVPEFAPIDEKFRFEEGMILNSMGCDGGNEVARYEVVFVKNNKIDIITERNSPRPGRSGGGLINEHGRLVGVCWGTSDVSSGNGIGYFTPVRAIKKIFNDNSHGWLLEVGSVTIPIVDRDNPERTYPSDFLPVPSL